MTRYALILLTATALVCACLTLPTAARAADAASVDAALKDVAAYEFGKSRETLSVISDAVRDSQSAPEARKELVRKLLGILKGEATLDGKQFVCRQLSIAGGEECVPVLAGMLKAKETSDMARYALERIPGKAADKVLLEALDGASGVVKVGIVNSLGARQCAAAAGALGKLAKDTDKMVAEAAIAALGHIGDAEAVKALEQAKDANKELHNAWADAYLLCADKLAAKEPQKAVKMYEQLAGPSEPDNVKVAAFRGRVLAMGPAAVPAVAEALAGDNAGLRNVAVQLVRTLCAGDAGATQAFVAGLPKLQPAAQALLIVALADRGDKAALPPIAEASKSADEGVRIAAIAAMGKLGGAECAMPLATVAAAAKGAEHDAARASLAALRGQNVDETMIGEMKKAEPAVKAELARALTARNAVSAVPALIEATRDANEQVRAEAYIALGVLAGEKDLPAMVDNLVTEAAENPRKEAVNAVVAAAKRIPDENKRAATVLAKLPGVKDVPAQCALYTVLGQVGDVNGLKPLVEAAKGGKGDVKDAAVRALSGWPMVAGIDDLLALATASKDDTHRVLLMRGLLRLLELPSDRTIDATLPYYEKALKIAKKSDEKKMVIGGLANVKSPSALGLVEPYLDAEEVKKEAALAASKIKASGYKVTASANEGDAREAVDGKMDSRWSSDAPQKPDMSFTIDMGAQYEVSKITLDTTPSANDFPRGYKVFLTNDQKDWGAPVAEGKGSGPVTEIALTPKTAQYIKIVQTGSDEKAPWSIHELKIESKRVAKGKK